MFRKKLLVLITILFFFLSTIYAVVNQVNNSQQLDANEVSKLAKEIKLLQAQIANLDTQKITDDIVVGLGSQQKVSNDQFNDFDKSTKVREQYLQQQVSLSSSDDREVDVGNQVKITTQGEVSYVGSFSSNNTVPIGQLPSNLFASSILRQRAFFDDYSIFLVDLFKLMHKSGMVLISQLEMVVILQVMAKIYI